MTEPAWSDVERLLSDALDLPPDQRQAFLHSACGDRGGLAAEVRSLLAEADRPGPLDAVDAARLADDGGALAGRLVGPYRLVREIGRGGMGSVWLAERDDRQFEKRVAVKLLSAGLPASEALRRFRDERQILASLEHPHIVHLLDAGRSDDGLHYIVMAFVEGVAITEYCRARSLDVAARVALLRTIASAVHFAHQRLVVHRDLKPANILVTADGQPRLLDFGVAKILAPESASATVPLLHLATPAYASPEQLRGLPVTTSTDVYSLGVLARELLGSARVGDLDAIVSKATRPLPEDRYASAEELAADLGRYLAGEPVLARGGALRYRLQKFVARHRVGVLAGGLAALAAIAGVSAIVWQARIARQERRAADARFDDVRQLAGSMIFDLHDRIAGLPGSTAAREALVTKALQYLGALSRDAGDDPTLAMELAAAYLRVADVQFSASDANLGDTTGALASLDAAQGILDRRLAHQPDDVAAQRLLARTHLAIGGVQLYLRKPTAARASVETGVRLCERLAASGDIADRRELAGAYHRLADVLTLETPEASLVPRRRALEMFEALLAARPDDDAARRAVARACKALGSTLNDRGRYTEAESYFTRALAIDERRVAALPQSAQARLDLSFDLSLLGTLRMNYKDPRGALPYWIRTVAVRQALVDADPKDARSRGRLAFAYVRSAAARADLGDFEQGLADANAALALAEALVAANPDDAIGRSYMAGAWLQVGRNEAGQAKRGAAGAPAHRSRACASWRQALGGYEALVAVGRAYDADQEDVAAVRTLLASCPAVSTRRDFAHP